MSVHRDHNQARELGNPLSVHTSSIFTKIGLDAIDIARLRYPILIFMAGAMRVTKIENVHEPRLLGSDLHFI